MRLSLESLRREADATGFRPEVLEKVFLLLDLLEAINQHPTLNGRLALKGGTALNLFLFNAPRLSVDIDLNYIIKSEYISSPEEAAGEENQREENSVGREAMLAERPGIEQAIELIARRLGLAPQTPKAPQHAGRSWTLRYPSALGGSGNLKIDLVYTLRLPLWPPVRKDSILVGSKQATGILVLDDHELAGGKLVALLARRTSRDLFDAHKLLREYSLDAARLRLAFVLYGAMNPEDWRTITTDDIGPATRDLETYLRPLLRIGQFAAGEEDLTQWGARLVAEVREALTAVLPLRENEMAFLNSLLNDGQIEPTHLTTDAALAQIIRRHPALLWKAHNVQSHMRKKKAQ